MRGAAGFKKDDSVLSHKMAPGTMRRVIKFGRPYYPVLSVFLFLVMLDSAAGLINPLIYRQLINRGILTGNTRLVMQLALTAAGVAVIDSALTFVQRTMATKIGLGIVFDLRKKVFAHVQQMSVAFFSRTRTGAMVSRLNADVSGVNDAFTDILSTAVGNVLTVTLVLTTMFVLSWRLTLASLVLIPAFILPARFIGGKMRKLTREAYDRTADMNNLMIERFNVGGAMLAKVFGRPDEDLTLFANRAAELRETRFRASNCARLLYIGLGLMAALAVAVVYGWGGTLAARHVIDVGTLIALVSYLLRLYGPLTALGNLQVDVLTTLVSFERVFEVLDLQPMVAEKSDAKPVPPGAVRLEFADVSFRYPTPKEVSLASLESVAVLSPYSERTILHEVSFVAEPGQMIALVGPSGAGKSTLAQLALRLYDPRAGVIRINGLDLRNVTTKSIQESVGMVMQDAHLFHDTLRANLLYARPHATDAEIQTALSDAQILATVEALPQGLDTVIGERGHRLSGGERQRVAIARLLLKAPPLVILDEATAHLDSESERAIQQAFRTALVGRTSLVIAHRLSTVQAADQILVLEKGRIVQRGRHEELLEAGGLYAQLYRTQFANRGAV
jgi:ATP-binding cassette subfamily B protein